MSHTWRSHVTYIKVMSHGYLFSSYQCLMSHTWVTLHTCIMWHVIHGHLYFLPLSQRPDLGRRRCKQVSVSHLWICQITSMSHITHDTLTLVCSITLTLHNWTWVDTNKWVTYKWVKSRTWVINRVNVFSMAKLGRQGWCCTKDRRTETRRRHYQMALGVMCSIFTWINDICRQTPTYSSASPQRNLVPRQCPPILFVDRRSRAKYSTHSAWSFDRSHEVNLQIQVMLKRETF